ncbi:glycosyltransferase family 4 protein [Cohnella terricola]|uniref:Glycosyltransferase family 1 protein n=1 Tax=Cohnella terricola TaxID=1289167 RepID=A0A559JIQ4_9BACL|nr:glycosyltransferase family 1 protein [Cohnella terricola]TVX99752.1 glycosyltransferase family 1 protein [Cohnella terricola]
MPEIRLALFTDTYAPEMNGVAKTLERWTAYLRSRGVACQVFAPSRPRKEDPAPDLAERLRSMRFFLYPELRFAVPQMAGAESKLLEFNPTVVHVATPFGVGVTGRQLALKHGIPLVASHHTHYVRYLPFYNLQWLAKATWKYMNWFHRPCKRIYVPSPSVLEECRADGWEGLRIWSRGVDTSLFRPEFDREGLRDALGLSRDRFTVLYAGRLAPEKQTEVAVEAVSRFIRNTGIDAELLLAGDGPFVESIRTLTERLRVPARFLGALPQSELRRVMAGSDVMLFPSATETFGNVVLEAMACGLPVIGAAGGAVPDNVRHGDNGILCPPGDADAFAEALSRLHGDAELRTILSAAGVREASVRSWDGVFARLLADIEEASVPALQVI